MLFATAAVVIYAVISKRKKKYPEYKNAEASFGAHGVFIYMQKQKKQRISLYAKKRKDSWL